MSKVIIYRFLSWVIVFFLLGTISLCAEITILSAKGSIGELNTGSIQLIATSQIDDVTYTLEVLDAAGDLVTNQSGLGYRYTDINGPLEILELPPGRLILKFVDSNGCESTKEVVIEEEGDLCSVIQYAITERKNVELCADIGCSRQLSAASGGCIRVMDDTRMCCGLGKLNVEIISPHDEYNVVWVYVETGSQRRIAEVANAHIGTYRLEIYTSASEEPCITDEVLIEACNDYYLSDGVDSESCSNRGAGALKEEIGDIILEQNGFRKFNGKIGSGGFDGLYIKTDPADCLVGADGCKIIDVIISEVKPFTGSIALTRMFRGIHDQMSADWINDVLDALAMLNPESEILVDELEDFLKAEGAIRKIIVSVDTSTGEVIVLNYGKHVTDG